jgi:hypothetical protein
LAVAVPTTANPHTTAWDAWHRRHAQRSCPGWACSSPTEARWPAPAFATPSPYEASPCDPSSLLARQRDAADRRRHIVTITPKGTKLLAEVDAILAGTDDDLFAALTPDERTQLERLLEKVADTELCGEKY